MMKCRNCGKEIIRMSEGGPWIHDKTYSIDCKESTVAEPDENYVSFGHDPHWCNIGIS